MLPIQNTASLCPGDVLIHATRGAAIVDQILVTEGTADDADTQVCVELTERRDPGPTTLSTDDLSEGWHLATPGGLFERSVLYPDEAAAQVAEHPGDVICILADELGSPVDQEQASTWLVSRGLLPAARVPGWWSSALEECRRYRRCMIDTDGRLSLRGADDDTAGDDPNDVYPLVKRLGARARFELLDRVGIGTRQAVLDQALSDGDTQLAAVLVRWPGTVSARMHARLDRLLSSGHRPLATRLAQTEPRLVAPALLADARINEADGLAGDVLAALPPTRRASLLMELLVLAADDIDALDAAEVLIDTHNSLPVLIDLMKPVARDPATQAVIPKDGRWNPAIQWMRTRGADVTMEMPSLHPTPLLRETGRLPVRDAFAVSIALARSLGRRHAEGHAGGIRGARLHRAEWRVDLGPVEPSTALDDVHDAMRMVVNLLVGRLPIGIEIADDVLIAHLSSLSLNVPVDLVAVASRALAANTELRPADGLALWLDLERAQATAKLREAAPPRANLALELGHDTHIGALKSRLGQTNQDALFFHQHGPLTLLLVADGISISTAGSGNLASALLVQALAARWEAEADSLVNAEDARIFEFQQRALEDGNTAICKAAYNLADGDLDNCIPMGTTAVMATIRGGVAYLSSVGDSRIYLVGRDGCALLTSDGNLREDWILAMQGGHPFTMDQDGAALTSYLGHFDEADQPAALPPRQRAVSLLPGEHLLLCTDGLTDFAAPDPGELCALIEDTLDSAISMDQACRQLVAAANAGGGGDNITVLLARVPG